MRDLHQRRAVPDVHECDLLVRASIISISVAAWRIRITSASPMRSSTKTFALPWEQRRGIKMTPNFEREVGLRAYRAWSDKPDQPSVLRAPPREPIVAYADNLRAS